MAGRRTPISGRRRWAAVVLWCAAMAVVLGGLVSMPALARQYFWNWMGSQDHVIDELLTLGHWEAAETRAERLMTERPWDPRPFKWRADAMRDRLVAQGRDPHRDSRVADAYEEAGRMFFRTAGYPYIVAPAWTRTMAETYLNWGLCEARRGRMDLAALCFEYAADVDPRSVDDVFVRLGPIIQSPQGAPEPLLLAVVRVALRHRSTEEALSLLERFTPHLDSSTVAILDAECRVADLLAGGSEMFDQRGVQRSRPLPTALLRLQYQVAGMNSPESGRPAGARRFTLQHIWRRGVTDWESAFNHRANRLGFPAVRLLTRGDRAFEPEGAERGLHSGWMLANNGELTFQWALPLDCAEICWLMVRATDAMDIWPVIGVSVNGGQERLMHVRNEDWIMLPVEAPSRVVESLTVRYHNDGGLPKLAYDPETGETSVQHMIEDRNVEVFGLWSEIPSDERQEV